MRKIEKIVLVLLIVGSVSMFIGMCFLMIAQDKDYIGVKIFMGIGFGIFLPIGFSSLIWSLVKGLKELEE
jgi:hypothetical protein